jgi:ligand-binding SRPBCC domain-containing protein
MPTIELVTNINAPVETCFDLARSIDLHVHSTTQTNERAVAGVTSGLISLNDTVTWEATHFFVRQRLTVEIVAYDRPRHFRDSMLHGAFEHFDHDHYFEATQTGTQMTDVFDYSSPMGVIGKLANLLFVDRHMRKLLMTRNELIKSVAESPNAERYLVDNANAG